MNKRISFTTVVDAANAIEREGGRASVRTVRARLGGGSPNELTPLLKQWRSDLKPVPDIAVDPGIIQLIARQVGEASLAAAAEAEARLADALADADTIAAAGQAAEQHASRLELELAQAKAQIQQLTGQLEERAREIENVKNETSELVASADAKAQRERETAEAVRQDLVRANIRVEAVPRLEADLADLRSRLIAAENELAAARQTAAVASAKEHAEATRSAESLQREKIANETIQRLEKELAELRSQERAGLERSQQLERDLVALQSESKALLGNQPHQKNESGQNI